MNETQTIKTISKYNTGFPEYLDFDKLRAAAIEYIGNLSGKIWTDHNIHDPGITILEVLIYALMDLGYRTNLPAADLFAANPEDKSKDNNFFTPSAILANNPLTITDLRKMLVDLEGIKNAWLEIDEDTSPDFCKQPPVDDHTPAGVPIPSRLPDACKCERINGLYHVYVQLEEDPEKKLFKEWRKNKHRYQETIRKIKQALMAHRNLCEDYLDINVLCSFEIGICADIELTAEADPASVYCRIVEALSQFFSPSPRFYTFQQLIEKGRTVDEIFAGRPFNITESHGFVDVEEFEQLRLRKLINLSDVYELLFKLDGVSDVRNLGWIKCCEEKQAVHDWQLKLPENYIPEFSPSCSGIRFSKFGLTIDWSPQKDKSQKRLSSAEYSKAIYKLPSPYLQPEFPKGNYRNDLAKYYSIQNEFPKVYGISEGGLAIHTPVKRVAQARQLQGFLLFFDQLLANYLTQLKNVRSLFAFSSPKEKENAHTYFINQLTDVPHFKELVRFRTETGIVGNEGTILTYPTSRKNLEKLIREGKLRNAGPLRRCNDDYGNDFPNYSFCYAVERSQAMKLLMEDLKYGDYNPVIVENANGCFYFYIITSSSEIALISKGYYKSEQETKNAAASLQYVASFTENYREYIIEDCATGKEKFSFDIELNLNTYSRYLHLIVEDEKSYLDRRQQFLDHLLSRFAEKFTDYALLSSGFLSPQDLDASLIKAKEKFLTYYDDISSNRGKAYDYSVDGWNNYNISGFEKRFKALTGIENWKKHYLCNFIVESADEEYRLTIRLFNEIFIVEEKTFDKPTALASLKSVFQKLSAGQQFDLKYVSHEQKWKLSIKDDEGTEYLSGRSFAEKQDAANFAHRLNDGINFNADASKYLAETSHIYKVLFSDLTGKVVAETVQKFQAKDAAGDYALKIEADLIKHLKNEDEFKIKIPANFPSHLLKRSTDAEFTYFIKEDDFEFKDFSVYKLEKEGKRFSLLNKKAAIQFDSLVTQPTVKLAKEEYRDLLRMLHAKENYSAEYDQDEKVYKIFVQDKNEKKAIYYETFSSEQEAEEKIREIISQMQEHTYIMKVSDPIADSWEIIYLLNEMSGEPLLFQSKANFEVKEEAEKALSNLYSDIPKLDLSSSGKQLILTSHTHKWKLYATSDSGPLSEDAITTAENALQAEKDLFILLKDPAEESFEKLLKLNKINPDENFIYKLVDKDNLLAYHPSIQPIKTRPDAETQRSELIAHAKHYNLPDIALGGDITVERKDAETRKSWFHYVIKLTNRFYSKGKHQGKELVLFESIRGYKGKEDAERAFHDNYPFILRYALQEKNYGIHKPISFKKVLVHDNDACYTSPSLVFIPKATSDEFNGYEVQRDVILIVKTYPLRFKGKKKVCFSLGRIEIQNTPTFVEDWRGKKVYDSARKAMAGFKFFMLLLKYAGNYFIDWDEKLCVYKIYIREVLAISAHGFSDPEEAWGPQGVEKFICVSQSKDGFHNYWNKLNCSYSFYVACGNKGLIHPCSYETPRRRDAVLAYLFKARKFSFFDLITVKANHVILNKFPTNENEKDIPIAKIYTKGPREITFDNCEWLIKFFETVYFDENYFKEKDKWILKYSQWNPDNPQHPFKQHTIAESIPEGISLKQWKTELLKLACYFPVFQDKDNKKFYLDIHLPGFAPCEDDLLIDDPCRHHWDLDCPISCYTAWKSECCFNSCCDALEFYTCAYALLQSYENYKPVYDCECGSYRIELHPRLNTAGIEQLQKDASHLLESFHLICKDRRHSGIASLSRGAHCIERHSKCLSEIVAINPQAYETESMACKAVERAKKLINSEGLHLVEHILLRPRCKNDNNEFEECDCPALPRPSVPGKPEEICHFKWTPSGDLDPCEEAKEICFTPGCDPYSFIVTVALPAWPQRFRSESARKIIEKLLYKEAPAHVLLRILWLNPREFCCFEYYFKLWNEWLAQKLCTKDYSNCNFLEFLFKKEYRDPYICRECQPCPDELPPEKHCFEIERTECADFSMRKQLNDLFNWESGGEQYTYDNCEPCRSKQDLNYLLFNPALLSFIRREEPEEAPSTDAPEIPVPDAEAEAAIERKKIDLGRKKDKMYKANLKPYEAETNELIIRTKTAMKKRKAEPEYFGPLLEELAGSKKLTELGKKDRRILIQNVTWRYLDIFWFNKEDADKMTALKGSFKILREHGFDMKQIYDEWVDQTPRELAAGLNFSLIRRTLVGK
jgi:hypothetical protein